MMHCSEDRRWRLQWWQSLVALLFVSECKELHEESRRFLIDQETSEKNYDPDINEQTEVN